LTSTKGVSKQYYWKIHAFVSNKRCQSSVRVKVQYAQMNDRGMVFGVPAPIDLEWVKPIWSWMILLDAQGLEISTGIYGLSLCDASIFRKGTTYKQSFATTHFILTLWINTHTHLIGERNLRRLLLGSSKGYNFSNRLASALTTDKVCCTAVLM
jgi:hypothetical protein